MGKVVGAFGMGKAGFAHYTNYDCDPLHCDDRQGKPCYGEDDEISFSFSGALTPGQVWTSESDFVRICTGDDCLGAYASLGIGGCTPGGTGGDTESIYWKITPPKGTLANSIRCELIYPDYGGTQVDFQSGEHIKVGFWRAACCGVRVDTQDVAYLNHTGNFGCSVANHIPAGNYIFRITNLHPTKSIFLSGAGGVTSAGAYGAQAFAPAIDQRITLV